MVESLLDLADALESVSIVRDTAARVLRAQWSPQRTRALLEEPPGWSPDLWATVTGLGWADLLAPAADGGGGGTTAQLAGIAEEVGRAVAPIPLVPAAVAAWCAGPSVGLRTVAFPDADAPSARIVAHAADGGVTLSGTVSFAPYGSVADTLVVAAVREDSGDVVLCVVDAVAEGVTTTPLRALDAAPLADITFDAVRIEHSAVLAEGHDAHRMLDGARARRTVGWAAELVGVAAAVHDAATEYATQRVAFGRPIGAFQAIKHRLVDLRGDIEVARALVHRAARAVDGDAVDADAMVALAAFWATERLRAVPEGAIQVFGGIGYTWEHDAHLSLRRAAVLTALLPTSAATGKVAIDWLQARETARPD